MDSSELIELFYNRAYEKFVNKQILDDKNYIVPRQQLTNYVHELVSVPFEEFIDYIKEKGIERSVEASDVTQFSSFSSCEIEMCNALIWANNPGCQFVDIGRFFPNSITAKNYHAYRRYGENHIKASAQLGLAFEYYKYWYLSCLGYIYPDLDERVRKQLLARTIIRNRLYQQLLIDILENDVNPEEYLDMLPEHIVKRRLRNVCAFFEICLDECRNERIKIYDLINNLKDYEKSSIIKYPIGNNQNLRTYLCNFDYHSLSNETTIQLIKKYRKGDSKATDLLVKGYMKLVLSIAKTYAHKGVEFDDLIQEGVIGLTRALDHFDINIKGEFSKYAQWWIRQAMMKAIFTQPFIVRVPLHVMELHKKVWNIIEKYEQENGYPPSIHDFDEICDFVLLEYLYQLPSDLKDMTCSVADLDSFESENPSPDYYIEKEGDACSVYPYFMFLTERDAEIVKEFYGIGGLSEGQLIIKIAERHHLSCERVRQILESSISKIKKGICEKENIKRDIISNQQNDINPVYKYTSIDSQIDIDFNKIEFILNELQSIKSKPFNMIMVSIKIENMQSKSSNEELSKNDRTLFSEKEDYPHTFGIEPVDNKRRFKNESINKAHGEKSVDKPPMPPNQIS